MQSKRAFKLGSLKKTSGRKSSKSSKQKTSTSPPNSEEGEFEKRLQFLKGLRDKKLIDDAEYKHKKMELLKQFP